MESQTPTRSQELMTPGDTALLVIDVQEKLIGLVPGYDRLVWNIGRLIDGALILSVPVLATEQYPKGLGTTTAELARRLPKPIWEKLTFSCAGCNDVLHRLAELQVTKVLVAGIEAHVCVLQTALDLLAQGYRVYAAVDAIGARFDIDCQTALRRLESSGATLVTTEMALFEWCQTAGTPAFKQLSALVKQPGPDGARARAPLDPVDDWSAGANGE
jgi:nicotinamidase-related amidase